MTQTKIRSIEVKKAVLFLRYPSHLNMQYDLTNDYLLFVWQQYGHICCCYPTHMHRGKGIGLSVITTKITIISQHLGSSLV